MLPLPNLDDKTFDELVEYAKKIIPGLAPDWTDFNLHDPGITFIELFAWLTEIQIYYLNKVRDESYLKFFKLIGLTPNPSVCSKAVVYFSFKNDSYYDAVVLPSGTKLYTSSGDSTLTFETINAITINPLTIERVISFDFDNYAVNNSKANAQHDMNYYAFSKYAKADCSLWIGFDKPLKEYLEDDFKGPDWMEITFNIYDEYPVQKISVPDIDLCNFEPPVKLLWQYYGEKGWTPLQITFDHTLSLTQSGRLGLKIPDDMKDMPYIPSDDSFYWIRATIIIPGKYELSPQINSIVINATTSIQKDTIAETHIISSDSGQKTFVYYSYLAVKGVNTVQQQIHSDNPVWRDVTDNLEDICVLEKDERSQSITITLKKDVCIRLISFLPEHLNRLFTGSSNGFPNQTHKTGFVDIVPDSLTLQVGEMNTEGLQWFDWKMVDNFDSSSYSDKHYTLDPENGIITFGNGINGVIPPSSAVEKKNIRIVSCCLGGGSNGNVAKGSINKFADNGLNTLLEVKNPSAALGGSPREDIDKTRARVFEDMKKLTRAVTSSDYEALAYSTPGLRVAKAKALPLYSPGIENYPRNTSPACVSVVVLPYSEESKPTPGAAFLKMVYSHLDKFRLITTKLYVLPPEFADINVTVKAKLKPGFSTEKDTVSEKVLQTLTRFLNPINGGDDNKGWEFGKTVFRWKIYRLIQDITEINYIEELYINTNGKGTSYDADNNILIPPNGMVCPGRNNITISA